VLLCLAVVGAVKLELIDVTAVKAGILSQVARVYPDKAGAYTLLGKHYCSSGRSKEAVQACERLVGIKPDDASAHALLGNVYY
jgi:Flp pilus assembly protein TadD